MALSNNSNCNSSIIELLPSTVLDLIFGSSLLDQQDLINLSSTCKSFSYLAQKHLYRNLFINDYSIDVSHLDSFHHCWSFIKNSNAESCGFFTNLINISSTLSRNPYLYVFIENIFVDVQSVQSLNNPLFEALLSNIISNCTNPNFKIHHNNPHQFQSLKSLRSLENFLVLLPQSSFNLNFNSNTSFVTIDLSSYYNQKTTLLSNFNAVSNFDDDLKNLYREISIKSNRNQLLSLTLNYHQLDHNIFSFNDLIFQNLIQLPSIKKLNLNLNSLSDLTIFDNFNLINFPNLTEIKFSNISCTNKSLIDKIFQILFIDNNSSNLKYVFLKFNGLSPYYFFKNFEDINLFLNDLQDSNSYYGELLNSFNDLLINNKIKNNSNIKYLNLMFDQTRQNLLMVLFYQFLSFKYLNLNDNKTQFFRSKDIEICNCSICSNFIDNIERKLQSLNNEYCFSNYIKIQNNLKFLNEKQEILEKSVKRNKYYSDGIISSNYYNELLLNEIGDDNGNNNNNDYIVLLNHFYKPLYEKIRGCTSLSNLEKLIIGDCSLY
ncbi:F-box protein ASCRUDRAFT_71286 [Ascoidea rubescens DSM 1968]|uniref:F-box domain-containing protein n=1 Tax=Ascoidea rubescens DSM 1968 TaxID=1344418 RepID=A0A1D2VDR6_9ASCO|nr:hypothetical protein ASCRUDRAFT_71286 [Ascoidea rubescens DSM 1968]ODV59775.1 hypothetical protein ASCRUDRAFT_71286 [Ascoidea rubescens DSM 1968]